MTGTVGDGGRAIVVDGPTDLLDSASGVVGRLRPDGQYPVLREHSGWYETRDEEGHVGWVAVDAVRPARPATGG